MSQEKERWYYCQGNSKVVRSNLRDRRKILGTVLHALNLQSNRSSNCARHVTRSHQLTRFQTQSSKVFGGVGAMTKATWCWGCPSRNTPKFAAYLKGKASVYISYGTDAYLRQSKGIDNLEVLTLNFDTGNHVTKPNPTECKEQPQQGLYQVAIAKENWLASCQCSQQNRTDCYHVTRGGSLTHSHLAFAKGAK